MTVTARRNSVRVTLDGVEVQGVLGGRWSHDYEQRTAECEVIVQEEPTHARYWQEMQLAASGTQTIAPPTRFSGFHVKVPKGYFPMRSRLVGRGPLVKTEVYEQTAEDGVSMVGDGAGATDEAQARSILTTVGLGPYFDTTSVGGTGAVLGTILPDEYVWRFRETAQAYLERLDYISWASLRQFRTFEWLSGLIVRQQVTLIPATSSVATFTEGVDFFLPTDYEPDILGSKNVVSVVGGQEQGLSEPVSYTTPTIANPVLPSGFVQSLGISSPMIEQELDADVAAEGVGISCETIGTGARHEHNGELLAITFETWRDDYIGPGQTITVHIPKFGSKVDTLLMTVKRIEGRFFPFRQRITAVRRLGTTAPTSTNIGPRADFTMLVEVETVIVAGAETTLYVIHAESTSLGMSAAIASSAWSASGSGLPAAGTQSTFTTSYTTAPAGSTSITLTVTDANGLTGTRTRTIPTDAQQTYNRRELIAAGTARAEYLTAAGVWNTDAEDSAQGVTVAGNGPIWGAGTDAMRSTDDLATSAAETAVFTSPSATVSAIWMEIDVSGTDTWVLAGASDGRIAISYDSGATWTVLAGPEPGEAVLRVVINRFAAGQWSVLTANGLYRADDYGVTWVTELTAAGAEVFRDLVLSHTRGMVVMSGGRLAVDRNGNGQTFAGTDPTDVIAVTADIGEDRFYAYDSAGNTWYTGTDGGTEFSAGAALPGGGVARGLWRDGRLRELLYFAAGTDGAYKSLDGFRSADGYHQLRAPGVGTSPAAADYRQIGAAGLLSVVPIGETTIVSAAGTGKVFRLGAEPSGWHQPGFDDSAWAPTVATSTVYSAPWTTPAGATWVSETAGSRPSLEEFLLRHEFTLGANAITASPLQINADNMVTGIWINGVYIYAEGTLSNVGRPYWTVNMDPALLLPGETNVLGLRIKNGNGDGVTALDLATVYRLDIT